MSDVCYWAVKRVGPAPVRQKVWYVGCGHITSRTGQGGAPPKDCVHCGKPVQVVEKYELPSLGIRVYTYEITQTGESCAPEGVVPSDIPLSAKITSVNDCIYMGNCESCGIPIGEQDDFHIWGDDVITCTKCGGPEESE